MQHDADGSVESWTVSADDLGRRARRALLLLTRCTEAILRAGAEDALFREICKLIVEVGGYRMCWIGVGLDDARRTVRPVASHGDDSGYLASADVVWSDTARGQGPTGAALRTGQPVLGFSFEHDPKLRQWRDAALIRGYRSSSALPLVHEGVRIGVMTMYAAEEHAFDQEEVQFLQQLADDVAFGVHALRVRDERARLEEQVRRAQKLDGIGRLAGGLAHDFNNLLAVILSCAESVRRSLADGAPVDPDEVDDLRDAAARARALTGQLLAVARKQPHAPDAVDLNALVRAGAGLLRRALGERVALALDLAPDLWPAWADPAQLDQVLVNLAMNARDALPEGGPITVETRNLPGPVTAADGLPLAPGDWVSLAVRDRGTGMSEEARAHLFEPFFTTKPRGEGTGLGLATVYGIVRQHRGHLVVRSAPGAGTDVTVYLPRGRPGPAGDP